MLAAPRIWRATHAGGATCLLTLAEVATYAKRFAAEERAAVPGGGMRIGEWTFRREATNG